MLPLILLFIAGYYLWLLLFQGHDWIKKIGGDAISIISIGIGAYLLFRTYKKAEGFGKYFWLFMYAGTQCYVIGECIWFYYESILKMDVPYPGWSDVFYLLTMLFHLLALVFKLYEKRESITILHFLLDVFIIMVVAITFSWQFIMYPTITKIGSPNLLLLVSVGYPIMDLMLLAGLVSLFLSNKWILPVKTHSLILTAFLIQIFADTVYMVGTVHDTYLSGSFLDPLWALASLLLGISGIYSLKVEKNQILDDMNQPVEKLNIIRFLLSYITVCSLFVCLLLSNESDILFFGFSVSVFLIMIRQVLTLFENASLVKQLTSLNEVLETKVIQRTRELSSKNAQLEFLANFDYVSTLPNRRLFEELLREEIEKIKSKSEKLAVVFFDIDRFKMLNDTFGYYFGDKVIKSIGDRLRAYLLGNHIASRFGGDEFTLLVKNIWNTQEVMDFVNPIKQQISQPFMIDGSEIHLTVSMGIALYPNDGETASDLIKNAEAAMSRAKKFGRNYCQLYTPDLLEESRKRLELENDLRKALENNQFEIHYQPQINVQTFEIVGAEALIRWMHPEKGLILPGQFISIAEETGMIVPLGEWMIRSSCLHLKSWIEKGFPPIKVGVNLSVRQFEEHNLVEKIREIIQETGINPHYLTIEITESMAMSNAEHVMNKMKQLRNLGVQISMDDFGTGYSSLAYLKKFPIQTLKIAREFIKDLGHFQNKAIVTTIITLAKNLHLNVIAEGVETEEQLSFLKQLNCNEIQGFIFSKPLPIHEFENLFERSLQEQR